jgi:phospholipase C
MIDAGVLAVELVNQGRRPAHMVVYDWTETVAAPVHVDVAIDGVVAVPVADDTYAVTVTGPNRFVREFAGTLSGSGGMIEVSSTVSPDPLAINLLIGNTSDDEVAVTIVGQVYGTSTERVMVAAGECMERFRWVANAHGWYDVVVTVEDDPTFHRRLTGHIETGRPSVTG